MITSRPVFELMCLADDVGLIRDLGPLEFERVERRVYLDQQLGRDDSEVDSFDNGQLVHETIGALADLEHLIGECRRRGLLG